jgi:type IV pilus biogenesis protein CpaD/CtpE
VEWIAACFAAAVAEKERANHSSMTMNSFPVSEPARWPLLLVIVAALGAGCTSTSTNPRKPGSYTAARHMTTGSNIPQPESIDNANSTMGADQMQNLGNNQDQNSMRAASGGGR